jgi:galactokinase/mevalonate kinase-like predicted kinase
MNPDIRKKAAIWLALVFVLGTATGGVFGYSLARRSYAATRTVVLSETERRAKKIAEMTQSIGLTAEQQQKADGIIKNAQTEIRAIHDKNDSEVDVVRMKARAQMREFLTAEQMPKFEQYMQRLDEERKKQKEAQQGK